MMDRRYLTQSLKDEARDLGFDLVGACPASNPPGIDRFRQWLAAGFAGRMTYLAERAEAYEHPSRVLPEARSIVMLGLNYRTQDPREPAHGQARVSRYAWGPIDYHDLIHARLKRLAEFHRRLIPGAAVRGIVDTAPLLEREFGQLAGLGWIGKNTLLLNTRFGSWFFLAALLTSEELEFDEPTTAGHCGSCRACLDACPTGALADAYRLDARKCISYFTIEVRDWIGADERIPTFDWLFGCDMCQEVCPWNGRTPVTQDPAFQPLEHVNPADLAGLFSLDDGAFRRRFRRTPLWRPRRRGLLRNAAIILGQRPHEAAAEGLDRGLNDQEPSVRMACAWAMGRYRTADVRASLLRRLTIEDDPVVRNQIQRSLGTDQTMPV